jgi:hypothetical protein
MGSEVSIAIWESTSTRRRESYGLGEYPAAFEIPIGVRAPLSVISQSIDLISQSAAYISANVVQYVSAFGGLAARPAANSWLSEAASDIVHWLNRPEGWDSYGARRIAPTEAGRALKLMRALASLEIPKPFITGTTEGGINLQWQSDSFDIQICYEQDSVYGYWQDKETFEEWEGSLADGASDFVRFMEGHLMADGESPAK